MDNRITGTMFFRDRGKAPLPGNKKLVMVCALLAVPDTVDVPFESTVPVIGGQVAGDAVNLIVSMGEPTDVSSVSQGSGAEGIFRAPIWRC